MTNFIHYTNAGTVWLSKSFDFKHGYGWFCQVYGSDNNIGFGFSKNKFTAYRQAINNANK